MGSPLELTIWLPAGAPRRVSVRGTAAVVVIVNGPISEPDGPVADGGVRLSVGMGSATPPLALAPLTR